MHHMTMGGTDGRKGRQGRYIYTDRYKNDEVSTGENDTRATVGATIIMFYFPTTIRIRVTGSDIQTDQRRAAAGID